MTRTQAEADAYPDLMRCQADILEGSFMTLGPRSMKRCTNPADVVLRETHTDKDGIIGSMSLCHKCHAVMREHFPQISSTVSWRKEE